MALLDNEKYDILFYLGYPGKVLVPDSTHFSNILADRLENLNINIEGIVRNILAELSSIDTQLNEARCRLSAMSVGDIKMNNRELSQLKSERNFWIRRLSDELDIPITKKGGVNVGICY